MPEEVLETLPEEEKPKKPKKEKAKKEKTKKEKRHISGITKRWLGNTFLIVCVILLIFVVMFLSVIQRYYNSTVESKLSSQYSSSVANFFSQYIGSTDEKFEAGAREYVVNFSQKNAMEVWVIDADGHVVISSSGFDVEDQTIPDFEKAMKTESRTATFRGKNANGEKIISQTYLLPTDDGDETGAVRYIISLKNVENQQVKLLLLIFFVFLVIVAIIVVSGMFFISSIIKPVNEINVIATRIAEGDLTARAPPQQYHDEISELSENINHMAEEISSSDKMKNDFISTVSHEMKTPLTAIKGWGETLLDTADADPELTKRGIEVIINESGRLTNVVNDLLDLSRIVNGRLILRTDRIDALAELDDTIFVFKDRSMREGIDLIYNAPHNPTPMVGDADRMKQVFVNVLDNAFKYNKQGGKVTVSADITPNEIAEDAPEDEKRMATLTIVVEDTGCGIAPEDLPKVKQKFYKSNISVKGSGIGLAVCDEIVTMHGGTLYIDSELDVGTTVTIRFPVEYVELHEDLPIPEEVIAESLPEVQEENVVEGEEL